jgi:hypothetical protein
MNLNFLKMVTGGTRLVSLSNLYIETGWEKLKDRKERHKTIQFYKMSNNLTPQYLKISNLIPQNFGMIHDPDLVDLIFSGCWFHSCTLEGMK